MDDSQHIGPVSWFTVHSKCVAMSSTGARGSAGQVSNGSGGSSHSGTSADGDLDTVGTEINNNPNGFMRDFRDRTEAWWTVGEHLEPKNQLTHQSARFTLTGNRVFGNQRDELWDLSDSLVELYETIQRHEGGGGPQQLKRIRNVENKNRMVDINDWLSKDISHGFIRVYAPDMVNFMNSRLVPVTLSTTVQQVAHSIGLSMNGIHVQFNGDIIRRMDAYEHPLVLQNQYLAGLGFDDINRIQEEGSKEDLGYLIRFYSGKPMMDSTFSRSQLQAYLEIKKGGVLQNWIRRLCVLSGTRLLIYKDKYKRTHPNVVQLARGAVEEAKFKGHDYCLRLTSTLAGEKIIYLAFTTASEYKRWFKKCKKATDKLPTSADLSNCHLEFLPENIFVNDQLAMLNLRHNVLKERPIEEDIFVIGWLDDLSRFTKLRSLNLADNNLVTFPLAVCHIRTLVELNIASNKLEEIPPDIAELYNLQALHIHNNHLTGLPDEMVQLRKLFILVLAFNRFLTVPPVVAQMTNIRVSEMENIIMAGNRIERIPSETLVEMKYVKKVDLRMNQLTLTNNETMKFTVLEHLTHLDIRDNRIVELDVRALRTLEYLNCERNDMVTLRVNGTQLKNLFAAQNCIETLHINPKPEYLHQINVSYNQLRELPDWLSDCFFLQKINVGYNLLTELPARLFIDAKKLRILQADHNNLRHLPSEVDVIMIEEIHIHHNIISHLPDDFFTNLNKLRVFNASKNRLTSLPPVNKNPDLNKLQELYLAVNALGDSSVRVCSGFPRLKVLNISHNEIHNLHDRDISKLEMLQDLNISGNELRSMPRSVGALSKLVVLRAHSNILNSLPDFHKANNLRVLDVGHNQLYNISVTDLMASQLNLLDMSLNTQLRVDPREFKSVKNQKSVCLVDATGQNRDLPGLKRQSRNYQEEEETDPNSPWKVGFSETSGIRNKLCVSTLKLPKFRDHNESIFGMFDGGHNDEIPKILKEKLPDILKSELTHPKTEAKYIKYSMLSAHRSLKVSGQKVGASAVVVHLRRLAADQMNIFHLGLANIGDVEVVLCRHGEATTLTRKFVTQEDLTECDRIQESNGIITEDNKVNGVTKTTRMLGCAFLYPHIIPCPYTCEVSLKNDDEFLIIANRGLWKHMSYGQAVEEIYDIGNPVVAAKRLMDIAQGYGSKENISILVIRLNTDRGPSLGRLKPPVTDMSIDDVQAAEKHEIALRAQRLAQGIARREAASKMEGGSHRVSRHREHERIDFADLKMRALSQSERVIRHVSGDDGSTDTLTAENVNGEPSPPSTHAERTANKHDKPAAAMVLNRYNHQNGHGDEIDDNDRSASRENNDPSDKYDKISRNLRDSFKRHAGHSSAASSIHSSQRVESTESVGRKSNSESSSNVKSVVSPRSASGDSNRSVTIVHKHSTSEVDRHASNDRNTSASFTPSQNSLHRQPSSESNHSLGVASRMNPVHRQASGDSNQSAVVTPRHNPVHRQPSSDSNHSVTVAQRPSSVVSDDLEEPREGSPGSSPLPTRPDKDLRPLPHQRFVKKNAAQEWELLLQKRLSSEVKDKELKQVGGIVFEDSVDAEVNPSQGAIRNRDISQSVGRSQGKALTASSEVNQRYSQSVGRSRGRMMTVSPEARKDSDMVVLDTLGRKQGKVVSEAHRQQDSVNHPRADRDLSPPTQPWYAPQTAANPAYALNPGISDKDLIHMTSSKQTAETEQENQPPKKPAGVRSRIAMFENIQQRDNVTTSKHDERRRTTFFSPARADPQRSVHVPPRRALSPPPNMVFVTKDDPRGSNTKPRSPSQPPPASTARKEIIIQTREGRPAATTNNSNIAASGRSQSQAAATRNVMPQSKVVNARGTPTSPQTIVIAGRSPGSRPQGTADNQHGGPTSPKVASPVSQVQLVRRPRSAGPVGNRRQLPNSPGPTVNIPVALEAGSPRQLPSSPSSIPSPPPLPLSPSSPVATPTNTTPSVQQANKSQAFHGSVESDLYAKVKRVKKNAPPPPGMNNFNVRSLPVEEEVTLGGKETKHVVEISYL